MHDDKRRFIPSEPVWKHKKETYEQYCERHKNHGTTPLDRIMWQRTIVEGQWPTMR